MANLIISEMLFLGLEILVHPVLPMSHSSRDLLPQLRHGNVQRHVQGPQGTRRRRGHRGLQIRFQKSG